ncbi:hypothetical protein MUP77_22435 [Candidatus Bathyarchaeota archaeon]|nr:hypothetical protein [Candidatus Bathyarchaeota archaeon]
MDNNVVDHAIWTHRNRGGYELSVVARLKGPLVSNVQYTVRLKDPENLTIDYMVTLEGFRELGELFLALHDFCKLPIYANEKDVEKLKGLLTTDNIKKFAGIIETSKLGKGK